MIRTSYARFRKREDSLVYIIIVADISTTTESIVMYINIKKRIDLLSMATKMQ